MTVTRPPQVKVTPGRLWLYRTGTWEGPLILRGGDEYGRRTLAVRLPGRRGVVWAYRWCTTPGCCERCPVNGLPHSGWVDGHPTCWHCSPSHRVRLLAGVDRCGCPDLYWCWATDGIECPRHGGPGVCCSYPAAHVPISAAVASESTEADR